MNCIFCKKESSSDKSIEHIIPESLGNIDHTLPRGVVCDTCNNYFARKVEKPLLDTPYFTSLRSEEFLVNKKGRPVLLKSIIEDAKGEAFVAEIGFAPDGSIILNDTQMIERLKKTQKGKLIFSKAPAEPPSGVMDRFLAKVAIEALALRLIKNSISLNEIIFNQPLDILRGFARFAYPKEWIYHQRIIYPRLTNQHDQILHEFDFLHTSDDQLYFVLAIFGVEYVINMGESSIDGYLKWLEKNDHISPLYSEKNIQATKA